METGFGVRTAIPADAATIAAMNLAMAAETEGRSLPADRLAAGVRAVFDDPAKGRYFVAEAGGRVVGCLLLTTEWSDWRNGTFLWIQSVYVAPEARRRGVYRAMHAEVLRLARAAAGVCGVRLYVEAENGTAQAVYEAMGMVRTSYRLYETDFTA
jgi:ribosomal protein S18 acetylase RimI-like enzyme